ncbi:hypothetical protein [Paenibacillus sp. NAIST15-1]|uniref:hypothetical protein n=1 Tax=Paenibacillus sp. NAIST15-1 TaxID=1605994 RepID=UPI001D11DC2F|nr:hypothetical protein [Paenibacillus sp. NAIST15-1]
MTEAASEPRPQSCFIQHRSIRVLEETAADLALGLFYLALPLDLVWHAQTAPVQQKQEASFFTVMNVFAKASVNNACCEKGPVKVYLVRPFLCRAISFWLSLDEERCDNQNDGEPNFNFEHRPKTVVNIVERLVYCAFRIFQRAHVYVIIPKHNQQQMRKSPI